MKHCDVVVIGGGPSGSMCSRILAEKGLNVVLLEKFTRGRYKPCAGGISTPATELMPVSENIIERKIVGEKGGLIVSASKKSIRVGSLKEPGYTVYRNRYDGWLMERAEEAGVKVINEAEATEVKFQHENVVVKVDLESGGEDFSSEVVVGAFGVSPRLYRFFGLTPPRCILGLMYEFALAEEVVDERIGDSIEVYFDTEYAEYGYAWIFPRTNGVSVGISALPSTRDKLERLDKFVKHHPIAREKLEGAIPKKLNGLGLFASSIPIMPLPRTSGRRFILVGDAAGLVDPLSFEGIGYALESGVAAASTIAEAFEVDDFSEDSLSLFEKTWLKRVYQDEIKFAQKLSRLMYGHALSDELGNVMVELGEEDEDVNEALRYILTRREPRRRVYEILMSKKVKLMKKLGLLNSIRVLARLF